MVPVVQLPSAAQARTMGKPARAGAKEENRDAPPLEPPIVQGNSN